MKTTFFKKFTANIPAAIAIFGFLLFSSLNQADEKDTPEVAATQCCTGYSISINKLRQFMLDSLHGDQFEGGVYAKIDLLNAISAVSGDSVYLLNALQNCQLANGTDLALTSPTTPSVSFINAKCRPCPGRACCPKKVCVARINRGCINYVTYSGPSAENLTGAVSLAE